jgi:uncharacterized protein YndB with AHSA1/START domain
MAERSTTTERVGDREYVAKRVVNGPARLVYEAWTKAELFKRWWVPRSFPVVLASCELDVRVGGGYRLVFGAPGTPQMAFFGRYLEVVPSTRLVWTNEESGPEGSITTVTFVEQGDQTHVTVSDLYPSTQALDEAIASGSVGGLPETLQQLDELVAGLAAERASA